MGRDRMKSMGKQLSAGESRVEKTCVVAARTDIRLLAALDDFYFRQGAQVDSKSELVRLALVHYHDLLFKNGYLDMPFDSLTFHQAFSMLAKYGNLHVGGQNRERLTALMGRESLEGVESIFQQAQEDSKISQEEIEQHKAIALRNARAAGMLAESRAKRQDKDSDEDMRVEQDPYEEVPDEASLLIPPSIIVED